MTPSPLLHVKEAAYSVSPIQIQLTPHFGFLVPEPILRGLSVPIFMLVPASMRPSRGRYPVDECHKQPFQLSSNSLLRVDFHGSRVSSDGDLILLGELDEPFGLSELLGEHLVGPRTGRNRQFRLANLVRQTVCCRLAGYDEPKNATHLSAEPTFRLIRSQKVWERGGASTSTLQSLKRARLAARQAGSGRQSKKVGGTAKTGRDASPKRPW